jgi:hypothetical protein
MKSKGKRQLKNAEDLDWKLDANWNEEDLAWNDKGLAWNEEAAPATPLATPARIDTDKIQPASFRYEDIVKLKEADIKALSYEQIIELNNKAISLIEELEADNKGHEAQRLREYLDTIEAAVQAKGYQIVGGAEDIRRQDWERNHARINSAIFNHLTENRSWPAINTISERTNLSRPTIYKHLTEGLANKYYQEKLKSWEYATDNIFKDLYYLGTKGNVQAYKVLLDNIYRHKEAAPAQNIKQQTNYIQINNTKIDEVVIAELPEEARLQIINIIQSNAINKEL